MLDEWRSSGYVNEYNVRRPREIRVNLSMLGTNREMRLNLLMLGVCNDCSGKEKVGKGGPSEVALIKTALLFF